MRKHLYKWLALGLYLSLAMPVTSFATITEQASKNTDLVQEYELASASNSTQAAEEDTSLELPIDDTLDAVSTPLAEAVDALESQSQLATQSLAINEFGEYVVYTYDELVEAVEIASDGDTIIIAENMLFSETISINKTLTIKGASPDIGIHSTGSSSYLFSLEGGSPEDFLELTLIDLLMYSPGRSGLLVNYGKINLENISASNFYAFCVLNRGTVIINGGEFTNNRFVVEEFEESNFDIYIYDGDFHNNECVILTYGTGSINIEGGNFNHNQQVIHGGYPSDIDHGINIYGGDFCRNGNGNYDRGGVIYSTLPVTISGGSFADNHSTYGGVICSKYITITGGEFSHNQADYGGVIYAENAIIKIYGSVMLENTAFNDGGVIYVQQFGVIEILDGMMWNNSATGFGGVVYIGDQDGTLEISGGMMRDNSASNGGAISVNINNLTIRNGAVVSNNRADQAYYVISQEDILLHQQQIDSTVTWTEGFDYIYNNLDVAYTEGSLTPPMHTVTFVIQYKDDFLPESSQIYQVESGERLEAHFSFITGYKAYEVLIDTWGQNWYYESWGDGELDYLDVILDPAIGNCTITIIVDK